MDDAALMAARTALVNNGSRLPNCIHLFILRGDYCNDDVLEGLRSDRHMVEVGRTMHEENWSASTSSSRLGKRAVVDKIAEIVACVCGDSQLQRTQVDLRLQLFIKLVIMPLKRPEFPFCIWYTIAGLVPQLLCAQRACASHSDMYDQIVPLSGCLRGDMCAVCGWVYWRLLVQARYSAENSIVDDWDLQSRNLDPAMPTSILHHYSAMDLYRC